VGIAGFILGLVAFFWMLIGLIPFLGWLNWLNIPVAVAGLVISILGYTQRRQSALSLIGIILCSIAIVIGVIRQCLRE
jgi:hypothetical protein